MNSILAMGLGVLMLVYSILHLLNIKELPLKRKENEADENYKSRQKKTAIIYTIFGVVFFALGLSLLI